MKKIKGQDPGGGGRTWTKDIGMGLAALVAVVYLLNPAAGILELIPDNIPIIGNLDEVAATGRIGKRPLAGLINRRV